MIGGKSTACSKETKVVLVETAFFEPEAIIGKTVKYDVQSDAAYKFERGTDPKCHEHVLRRFLKIVEQHTNIIDVRYAKKDFKEFQEISIKKDPNLINKILGTTITDHDYHKYLCKLGFNLFNSSIALSLKSANSSGSAGIFGTPPCFCKYKVCKAPNTKYSFF